MVQIRSNVFETNSSSMHSVAIVKADGGRITSLKEALAEDTDMSVQDGVLVIKDAEELSFGWGFEILDTAYQKIKYAIATYCTAYDDGTIEGLDGIMDVIGKIFPEIREISFPIEEYSRQITCGYIDHESYGTLEYFLSNHDVSLTEFITNRNIIVIIDNDNSCHFSYIINSGIFSKNAFDKNDTTSPYHNYNED